MTGSGGLEVRGGVAGIRARTDDMERAAGVLAVAGLEVAELGVRLGAVSAAPGLVASSVLAPLTFAAAEGAVTAAAIGPSGLVPAAARLELVGLRLRAAALAYTATDQAAVALAQAVPVVALGSLGLAAVGVVPWGVVAARVTGLGTDVAGAAEAAVAVAPGSARQAAQGLRAVTARTPFLHDGSAVAVAGAPHQVPVPAGVADLVAGVASCYPEGGAAPGTVRVLRVTHADGGRAWIVEIPGTQDWSPLAGHDPFDLSGDVASLAGAATAAGAVVTSALTVAGARTGEPVLLAGHSLGGMVAAGLAADRAFRSRFSVTHVLTAGSPIAAYPIPPGVQVLALEHTDDVVPSLDGRRDPDRPRWVTVRRTARAGTLTLDPQQAHEVSGYERTATLVDGSHDPSVTAWRAGLAPFLAGPAVTARGVSVVGSRLRRR